MSEKILPLASPDASLETAGGKGASLSTLTRAGFPVPPGFIVTTLAYRDFVTTHGLQPRILALAAGLDPDHPEQAEPISGQIQALFDQAPMPEDTAAEILQAYRALQREAVQIGEGVNAPAPGNEQPGGFDQPEGRSAADIPVAVRSSANAEDLPGFAFAGQQDTFLNITGADLLDAVKRCWASLWTPRAISYRARAGFDPEKVALAVVVQVLVPSEISGVLFTADPLTGRRGEIHIDASYGLGEAIVSGQVEPDHYTVDPRGWRITARQLGTKQVTIRPRAGGGVERSNGAHAGEQALSDPRVIALAQMGQRAADFYGEPQDIEWAWAEGRCFLLQSRPITSLYPLPAPLPASIAANAPRDGKLHVYFNFNALQGVADPITPLGIDVLQHFLHSVSEKMGVQLPPEQIMPQAGDRLFLDFGDLPGDPFWGKFVDGMLDSTEPGERDILRALLSSGRIPARSVMTPRMALRSLRFFGPVLRSTLASLARYQPVRERVLRDAEAYLAEIQASLANLPELKESPARTDLETSRRALAACLRALEEELPRAGRINLSTIPVAMIAGSLVKLLDTWLVRWLGEPPGAAMPLLRSLPGNVTVAMNLRLWAAAQAIRADPAAAAAVSGGAVDQLAAAYRTGTLPPAAQNALAEFLRSDGLRGVAEIDLGQPRWIEDPAPVIRTLQGYLRQTDPDQAPDVIYRRGAAQVEALLADWSARIRRTRLGWLKARLFLAVARRVRALASLREVPMYYLARALALYRQALLRVGESLVRQGQIDRADDLFFVPMAMLKRWAETGDFDLRPEIEAQRAIYARELLRRQQPRVLLSTGEAFYDAPAPERPGAEVSGGRTGDGLTGVPVSPGLAQGPARVILDPRGARLEPGEILVCPSTDPGWTPLFLTAAGLVMEIGGLMTHGSVVAREYGIPAVVGVRGATERIHTGQVIRVDGNTGMVTIPEGI